MFGPPDAGETGCAHFNIFVPPRSAPQAVKDLAEINEGTAELWVTDIPGIEIDKTYVIADLSLSHRLTHQTPGRGAISLDMPGVVLRKIEHHTEAAGILVEIKKGGRRIDGSAIHGDRPQPSRAGP